MADHNKCATSPGGSAEEGGNMEVADDDDPLSENQECVEETLFIGINAIPEKE